MPNKKFILELTEEEAQQLATLAEQHGNKFKPFAEYLLRLQLGTVKPPTVQPVQIPVKDEPLKDKPEQETKPLKVEPRTGTGVNGNTVAHIRKGEVIEQHKQGRYLQRKWHPVGILSNGDSLRVSTDNGFQYAYFAEDLEQYLEEPF